MLYCQDILRLPLNLPRGGLLFNPSAYGLLLVFVALVWDVCSVEKFVLDADSVWPPK